MKNNDVSLKYIIYKQPLSLDRLKIMEENVTIFVSQVFYP